MEGIVRVYVRRGARGFGAHRTNQGCGGGVGNGEEYAKYYTGKTTHGAEDGVKGAALGPRVHPEAIFLVLPGDGDKSGVK